MGVVVRRVTTHGGTNSDTLLHSKPQQKHSKKKEKGKRRKEKEVFDLHEQDKKIHRPRHDHESR